MYAISGRDIMPEKENYVSGRYKASLVYPFLCNQVPQVSMKTIAYFHYFVISSYFFLLKIMEIELYIFLLL